jgi:uncharacterized RDD family membrane protein YckC
LSEKLFSKIERLAKRDQGLPSKRLVAAVVDVLIFLILIKFFGIAGSLLGLLFVFLKDAMFKGQSPGKRLFDLQVIEPRQDNNPCSVRKSIIRNIPMAVVIALLSFPVSGWILFATVGLAIILLETFLVFSDEEGKRVGDIFAETLVINIASGQ